MEKVVIQAHRNKLSLDIKELWSYRDLFLILAYRDFRVRYAQTFLGLFWAILQPVVTLLIFVLIFGKALNVNTGNIPYPVFALTGMVLWSFFAFVLVQSGTSIVGAQEIVKKVYFPRIIIPLSKAVVGLVDLGIALTFLVVLLFYYQIGVSPHFLYFPIFLGLGIMAALSAGIWISALTIRYRDFQHVVPFLVQIGIYATPIAYPASLIPEEYHAIYYLNPMAGIVEGFRWSLMGGNPPDLYAIITSCSVILLFITGLYYFKRTEVNMADII